MTMLGVKKLAQKNLRLIFNDSHYYFGQETPDFLKSIQSAFLESRVLVIGNEYHVHPGVYLYPLCEGKFTIFFGEDDSQKVSSLPCSAGWAYNHPNTLLDCEKQFEISFGWHKVFIADITLSKF